MTGRSFLVAFVYLAAIVALTTAQTPAPSGPQTPRPAAPPRKLENLQVMPKDSTREAVVARMREFNAALGVRCDYCHDIPEGTPLDQADMASDTKEAKKKTRVMMKLTADINQKLTADLPARVTPAVRVDCVTCHRGVAVPRTLDAVLTEVIEKEGVAAAVNRYRELRKNMALGRYNFGEQTLHQVAHARVQAGKRDEAIAILELNAEHYPESGTIDFQLAELHRAAGSRDKAIERYKAAIQKNPKDTRARTRLKELESPQQ